MSEGSQPGHGGRLTAAGIDDCGRCELANAGHLPPLLAGRGGDGFMPIGGSLLSIAEANVSTRVFELAPGDVLLRYTDALIERRDDTLDAGGRRGWPMRRPNCR